MIATIARKQFPSITLSESLIKNTYILKSLFIICFVSDEFQFGYFYGMSVPYLVFLSYLN